MRNPRFIESYTEFFALKEFLYGGKEYVPEEPFDVSELDKRSIEHLFGAWLIGNASDITKRFGSVPEVTSPVEEEVEETAPEIAEVVEDTEESFKVKFKGQVKEIKRNQLRENGTLTKSALKLFDE